MINSVNLDFLKPKLINMDKFNCPANTKLLPPSTLTQQTKTFVTITGPTNLITDKQQMKQEFLLNHNIIKHQQQQKQQQERVRVQHLENHTKLQNNKCWNNFRTLNYTSASTQFRNRNDPKTDDNEIDVVNVEHLQKPNNMETPMNIQNKSAFNLELNNKKYLNNNNDNDSILGSNNNNNNNNDIKLETNNNNYNFYNKQQQQQLFGLINNKNIKIETQTSSSMASNQRTEDQNNAYRHIESVHNYAKSKSYEDDDVDNQSPNGSRHSSYLDDEEEDEDDDAEDDDDNDEDYNDDMDADYVEGLDTHLDVDYEDIFNRRRHRRFQKLSTSSDGALLTTYNNNTKLKPVDELRKNAQFVNKAQPVTCFNVNKINDKQEEEEEIHVDVDVETVESQLSSTLPAGVTSSDRFNGVVGEESVSAVKPDHHARRPMNAFLIFCKRHRAIVKERYKNLENRAITKILGDWWASLDANDKKCFTNLAQQNKDAFFSANPNFKWYKLPAPPLRSLNTRPAYGQEYPDGDNETNNNQEIISNNTRSCSNYFKLADEAQMGDLSQLMQDKTKNTNKSNNDLQQALGETSQFMSAHIHGNDGDITIEENRLKRRYHNENSFSSNSSEDDLMEPKKKSARSCKGKRYQELINSGQIATAVKKSKATGRGGGGGNENLEMNTKQNFSNCNSFNNSNATNSCQKRSISECDNLINYDLNGFDLEERIKELPALNLDEYLQRKRNTKKKKKFSSNGKKRGQRLGNNNNNGNNNINNTNNNTSQSNNECNLDNKFKQTNENVTQKAVNKQPTAVGSQKRKARKESITRRDISAIEQEVASLLPLTINGCCYLQAIEKDTETITTQTLNVTTSTSSTTSPIIPLQQNNSTTVSIDIFNNSNNNNNINNNITNNNNISKNLNNTLNDNISSSTSDLLILAEVAANRTEL